MKGVGISIMLTAIILKLFWVWKLKTKSSQTNKPRFRLSIIAVQKAKKHVFLTSQTYFKISIESEHDFLASIEVNK